MLHRGRAHGRLAMWRLRLAELDLCTALLEPLPETEAGNVHLLVIVDRFSKLARAIPLNRADAETTSAAFLDPWVTAYGPRKTILTDNAPQFRSTFF